MKMEPSISHELLRHRFDEILLFLIEMFPIRGLLPLLKNLQKDITWHGLRLKLVLMMAQPQIVFYVIYFF